MACHKPIEKWFIVVVFLLDKMTLQVTIYIYIFLIFGQLMRHSLIEPFHLSNLLQMLMTIEWSTLSSLSTSQVVVRESALMMALSWPLSTSNGWPLCSSSSRLLSPLQTS